MKLSARRLLVLAVSVLLVVLAVWFSGEKALSRLMEFSPWGVAGIFVLLFVNLLLVSVRLWTVLGHFGIDVTWKTALRASIAGNIAGLFMISLLGQVVGRHAVLQYSGVPPVVSASLAAYERIVVAVVSGVLGTLGGVYLLGQTTVVVFLNELAVGEIGVAISGGIALSVWLGGSKFESELFRRVFSYANILRAAQIVGLTLLAQFLVLGCFVLGAMAVSPGLPVMSIFAASAMISLAASIPITINGWGVREVASVYLLGVLGISAAHALTISVVVGLCSSVVILLFVPLCLERRSRA